MPTKHLCLRCIFLVGLGITLVAAGNAAAGTALEHAGTPIPREEAVVSGISVTLEETTAHTRSHLRVDLCGHEATRLPPGFPLGIEVSAPVQSVVVHHADASFAIGIRAEGRHATVTLTRDPFRPPEPWRVVLLVRVEGDLGAGLLLLGAARYPLPPALPVGHPTVVLGPGCDERYAGQPAPGRVGGHG
jgi:hypothetical protein